jgi:hypothetical protein
MLAMSSGVPNVDSASFSVKIIGVK